jgi:SAM-dependent methyltransferase
MATDSRVFLAALGGAVTAIPITWYVLRQCRRPAGWVGRSILWTMNHRHSKLTSWGLEHVQIKRTDSVLDIGCGGGLTISKIAALADLGTTYGVDYSRASVASSKSLNRTGIESGKVVVQNAPVSQLPFSGDSFDVVTAIETHYYWPDLSGDIREILRVLKPGGSLLVVAETFRKGEAVTINQIAMKPLGGALLSPDDHRDWLLEGGYTDVQVFLERSTGWICVTGCKPLR